MRIDDPFHDGELFVQRRANEVEVAQRNGGMIADAIPKGALRLIGQQPLVALGSLDSDGNVWASVLVGDPGFILAQDETHRRVGCHATPLRGGRPALDQYRDERGGRYARDRPGDTPATARQRSYPTARRHSI